MLFEWDEPKRLGNLRKHSIDFIDAKEIWSGGVIETPSTKTWHGERRMLALGMLDGRVITVVFVRHGDVCRIISARRARDYECKAYKDAFGRGA